MLNLQYKAVATVGNSCKVGQICGLIADSPVQVCLDSAYQAYDKHTKPLTDK